MYEQLHIDLLSTLSPSGGPKGHLPKKTKTKQKHALGFRISSDTIELYSLLYLICFVD